MPQGGCGGKRFWAVEEGMVERDAMRDLPRQLYLRSPDTKWPQRQFLRWSIRLQFGAMPNLAEIKELSVPIEKMEVLKSIARLPPTSGIRRS